MEDYGIINRLRFSFLSSGLAMRWDTVVTGATRAFRIYDEIGRDLQVSTLGKRVPSPVIRKMYIVETLDKLVQRESRRTFSCIDIVGWAEERVHMRTCVCGSRAITYKDN